MAQSRVVAQHNESSLSFRSLVLRQNNSVRYRNRTGPCLNLTGALGSFRIADRKQNKTKKKSEYESNEWSPKTSTRRHPRVSFIWRAGAVSPINAAIFTRQRKQLSSNPVKERTTSEEHLLPVGASLDEFKISV